MGKRIERIYQYIVENTMSGLGEKKGLSTSEVADHLAIQRSNASKDLNKLVKEGRVEKSDSRPVRYWAAGVDPSSREKYVPSYKESRPQREKAFLNGYKENPLTEIFLRRSSVPTEV